VLNDSFLSVDTQLHTPFKALEYFVVVCDPLHGFQERSELFFCCQMMNHYVAPNLSSEGLYRARTFFKVLAAMMEMFVFIYIGIVLFLEPHDWKIWSFTVRVHAGPHSVSLAPVFVAAVVSDRQV
jgi:hypothetical protein